VVVRGNRECTNTIVEFACKNMGMAVDKVMTPSKGETVNATTESHIYQVTIT